MIPSLFLDYSYSYNNGSLLAPIMMLVFLVVFLVPAIFYLITLQHTLKAVSPRNRRMEPGMVWLLLIPLFNLVWNFIVVTKIADSIQAELHERNRGSMERPGYGVGIAYSVLCATTWIPVLGTLALLGAIVCWIIYWVKINDFRKQLLIPHNPDSQSRIFGVDDLYGK